MKQFLITLFGYTLRYFFRSRKLSSPPKKIIILKPCCLGDVVLATPTIAALKQYYPKAQLDFAVGRWSRAVVEHNPHLDTIYDSGRVGQGIYTWRDVWNLARQLRSQRYDWAITLDRSPIVGLVPWLAGIPQRLGLDSFGRGFAHTQRVVVPPEPKHEAEIYLNCARTLIASDKLFPPVWSAFYPTPTAQAKVKDLVKTPFIIIHPTGGVNPGMNMLNKRWPLDRLADLADRFKAQQFEVVLSGTKSDTMLCQQVAAKMKKGRPQILAGELNLSEFGALCQNATLFVGGDTGAMHLAVAVGCKCVAIFGPSDPRRYGPFAPPHQVQTVWREIDLPTGGVGQGQVADFSWEMGASVEEVWAACCNLVDD